jgi:GH43 family beta-xylosidase
MRMQKLAMVMAIGLGALTPNVFAAGATYANPLLPSGPDPWVIQRNGTYYYMHTLGNRIAIWKTRDMAALGKATPITVWTPPATGPNAISIWAPELHFLDGKWYLYYTAAEKGHDDDAHRHVFVLENASADPTAGTWVDKGALRTAHNGIDGTMFEWRGKRYFVYSAYIDDHSDLIIAPMRNPWTLSDRQIDIAWPTHDWEMQGGRKILEAPEFLQGPDGKVFLTYSASACWSDDYALGLLTARADSDLTDPASWSKSPKPAFATSEKNGVYAPGHNAFFKSPDGKQDWLIYHANGGADWKCTSRRAPRIQPFHWRSDGTPDFGEPVRDATPLPAPAG